MRNKLNSSTTLKRSRIWQLFSLATAQGTFTRNIGSTYALLVGSVALSLALSILLARLLGPVGFGDYAYALNWVLVLSTLAALGMDKLAVRNAAAYSSEGQWSLLRGLVRWATIRVLLFSILVIAITILVRSLMTGEFTSSTTVTLAVAVLLIPILTLAQVHQGVLRGLDYIVQGLFADMIVRPLVFMIFLLGGLFAVGEMTAPWAMFLHFAAAALSLGLIFYLVIRYVRPKVLHFEPEYASRLWWTITIPFLVSASLESLNQRVSILMLGSMLDTEAAGIYNVAKRLAEPTIFVLIAVTAVLGPRVAGLYAKREHDELQSIVTKSSRIILAASLPIALVIIILGPWLLLLWGPEFRAGYTASVILIAGQIVNSAVGPVALLLNMTNHEREVVIGLAISTIAVIILNYILIPRYGVNGAAVASTASLIIWNIFLAVLVRKRLGIDSTIAGRQPR